MTKTDFKKEWKNLYKPSKTEFQVVEVPDMAFYKVDGHGTPGVVPEYTAAIEALYAMSYKTKFLSKKLEKDYVGCGGRMIWQLLQLLEIRVNGIGQ